MMGALATLILAAVPLLSLDQAVQSAEAHQAQLRESKALRQAAESRVGEARAPLFPQVVTSTSYRRTTGNRVLRVGTDPRLLDFQPRQNGQLWDFFNFGLTATQLVYDFGQTVGKLSAAEANARAQKETERAVGLSVVASVRVAFFAALAQKQLVDVARETVANQKRHLDQVEGFVSAQARPQIDLAQARLDVANAEYDLIGAENAYETAKAQLDQAMGVESSHEYDVADAALGPLKGEDGTSEAMVAEAIRARPELASLLEQAQAQRELIGAAKGAYGPTLSVEAGATEAGMSLAYLRYNYFGLVAISWPIFQGMLTPARVSEARANLAAVEARLELARQQVKLELEKARLALRSAKAAVTTAERALDAANERQSLAEGRYEANVGNAIELGDAVLARAAAAARKVQAEYLVSAARAALLQALGRKS